jgi:hypothetical protein
MGKIVHSRLAKEDPVGRRHARIECQAAQTATQLRLADSAVAEKQDLDLRVDPFAGPEVLVVKGFRVSPLAPRAVPSYH